jgi:predicted MFS family arabinose efflux permease
LRVLWHAVRSRACLAFAGFLFLWNFNPCSTTVVQLHMTGPLGLSEQFYGATVSLMAVASVVASLCYGAYCRLMPMRWLVHASIVLGIVSNLAYAGLAGSRSAALVTLVVGFAVMTATLIQLDLVARWCPAQVAGTTFALLMAVSNLGASLATWLGGSWYERAASAWGNRVAFQLLAVVGAAFTAGCWLLLPWLPREPAGGRGSNPDIP